MWFLGLYVCSPSTWWSKSSGWWVGCICACSMLGSWSCFSEDFKIAKHCVAGHVSLFYCSRFPCSARHAFWSLEEKYLTETWISLNMNFGYVPASLGVTSNECSDWICAARLGGTLQRYTQWYWVLYQFVEYVMKYTSTKKLQKTNNPNTSKKTFEHHKKRENSKVFVVDTHHEKVWSHSLWHREDHTHFLLGILRYFFDTQHIQKS